MNAVNALPAGVETWKRANGGFVHAYRILGTQFIEFEAWEPLAGHSTRMHNTPFGPLGNVARRPLPAQINAMRPGGPDRIHAVREWQDANRRAAEAMIREVYPS